MASIGWTKLAIIAKYAELGKEEAALDLAKENTARGLQALLQRQKAETRVHSILLHFTPAQHRVFTSVLENYGAKPAKNGNGHSNKEGALIKALRAKT